MTNTNNDERNVIFKEFKLLSSVDQSISVALDFISAFFKYQHQ